MQCLHRFSFLAGNFLFQMDTTSQHIFQMNSFHFSSSLGLLLGPINLQPVFNSIRNSSLSFLLHEQTPLCLISSFPCPLISHYPLPLTLTPFSLPHHFFLLAFLCPSNWHLHFSLSLPTRFSLSFLTLIPSLVPSSLCHSPSLLFLTLLLFLPLYFTLPSLLFFLLPPPDFILPPTHLTFPSFFLATLPFFLLSFSPPQPFFLSSFLYNFTALLGAMIVDYLLFSGAFQTPLLEIMANLFVQ